MSRGPSVVARRSSVAPPTRFFGREEDIDRVNALHHGGARLLTLLGPGGIGKTRLAQHVVERSMTVGRTHVFCALAERLLEKDRK